MANTATSTRFQRFFAAFDAHDVTTLVGFIAEGIELRLGNAEMVHGKTAFVDAVNAFHGSVAAVRHEILDVYRDGDVAIVETDVRYTRSDGNVVTLPCCNVFRLQDGLIAEYRSYVDASPVYA